jgi:hypothetical protein
MADLLTKLEFDTIEVEKPKHIDSEGLKRMCKNPHFMKVVTDCWDIYDRKGKDYTRGLGDLDRSDNFKKAAEFNKVSAFQAWGVYFYKHVSAIFKFIGDRKVESEPIEGRIHDVINYSILLLILVEEQRRDEERNAHMRVKPPEA